MNLKTTQVTLKEVLAKLNTGGWLVPRFQRAFVWSEAQVYELLRSIFLNRPIGMVTLWAQPATEGPPLTDWEKIKLRKAEFGDFSTPPPGPRLILDGRQRLTAIAMAFATLSEPDDRYLFGGKWYANISREVGDDEFIEHLKAGEIQKQKLDIPANLLAAGLIPLNNLDIIKTLNQNVHNRDFYPDGKFPSGEERERRSGRLSRLMEVLLEYQIPVAEIPDTVGLSEVCEIFNVLNQTGTKVSTFDLVHNVLFSDSSGKFVLRDKFAKYAELGSLGYFCDEDRPDLFCQLVTGSYLTRGEGASVRNNTGRVVSVKGGDLLQTPKDFYEKFDASIERVDAFAADFFSEIVGGDFSSSMLPYPVSSGLYLALRWSLHEASDEGTRFKVSSLNRAFRAFYWRNVLSSRYDQGFLTLFSTDLTSLRSALVQAIPLEDSDTRWRQYVANELDVLFDARERKFPRISVDDMVQRLKGDARGAVRQAFRAFAFSRTTTDLLSRKPLNRFTELKKERVELHHIFPKDWCRNNRGQFTGLGDGDSLNPTVDSFANLIPLSAESNKKWLAKSPPTALQDFQITFPTHRDLLTSAAIDEEAFSLLVNLKVDQFWDRRARNIAERLVKLQEVV